MGIPRKTRIGDVLRNSIGETFFSFSFSRLVDVLYFPSFMCGWVCTMAGAFIGVHAAQLLVTSK